MPNFQLCDRCNTLLPTPYSIVQVYQSDNSIPAQTKWLCGNCAAEQQTFFATVPPWAAPYPAIVAPQTLPSKVG